MYNINGTCYIRVPFTANANDINDFTKLTLKIRYDDAFVAYLNGQKVANSDRVPSNVDMELPGNLGHAI